MKGCDFEKWCREVRDPATAKSEGERVIRHGSATAKYNIACVPGGYAYEVEYDLGRRIGCGSTPWNGPFATRSEALDAALATLSTAMRGSDDARAVVEMLAGDGLFGFMEPTPANA